MTWRTRDYGLGIRPARPVHGLLWWEVVKATVAPMAPAAKAAITMGFARNIFTEPDPCWTGWLPGAGWLLCSTCSAV